MEKRKVAIAKASELYDKLLNIYIYITQNDNLTKAQKKIIKVQNVPENVTIDFYLDEDDLPIELIIDYVNRIDNRLVFEIKDGYKLELQTPGKMKLLGSTKELVGKAKNGEKSWTSWSSFSQSVTKVWSIIHFYS